MSRCYDGALEDRLASHQVPIGIVLPDLATYQRLVHAIAEAPSIDTIELSYSAPLYKATPAIVEALKDVRTALEKFDVYFEHGFLDEETRVKLASAFRQRYLKANPRSEGSDVFAASGDVLQFRFQLKQPATLEGFEDVLAVTASLPHDREVLEAMKQGELVDRRHLQGELKIFLDHVYNPRRRELPAVQEVMTGPRERDPVIAELMTDGALPGLFGHLLAPLVHPLDGALVILPG